MMMGEKRCTEERGFSESISEVLGCFGKVYLSVEEEAPYKCLKFPLVLDEMPESGPIGGIYSGLKNCKEDALFVVACDMPFVTVKGIKRLLEVYSHRPKITIAWAEDQEQPLLGIYPKSALPYIEKLIQDGDYNLMHALVHAGYVVVTLPHEDALSGQ